MHRMLKAFSAYPWAMLALSNSVSAEDAVVNFTGAPPEQRQLCATIIDDRAQIPALMAQKAREINPIRQEAVQTQITVLLVKGGDDLHSVPSAGTVAGFVGRTLRVVDEPGPGSKNYTMLVDLGCRGVNVVFEFNFNADPPQMFTNWAAPLGDFQPVLAEVNKGDMIRFNATFPDPRLICGRAFIMADTISFVLTPTSIQKLAP